MRNITVRLYKNVFVSPVDRGKRTVNHHLGLVLIPLNWVAHFQHKV